MSSEVARIQNKIEYGKPGQCRIPNSVLMALPDYVVNDSFATLQWMGQMNPNHEFSAVSDFDGVTVYWRPKTEPEPEIVVEDEPKFPRQGVRVHSIYLDEAANSVGYIEQFSKPKLLFDE